MTRKGDRTVRRVFAKTYERHWREDMDKLRAQAAQARTFGDYMKLEDAISDALASIRGHLKDTGNQVRRAKRYADRELADLHRLQGWGDEWVAQHMTWQVEHTARAFRSWVRARRMQRFERGIRDELKQGLAAVKRAWKDDSEELDRILKEWEADRVRSGRRRI